MLTLIFGVVLGTAITASLLIHALGWGLGLLAFALLGGVGVISPKGLLHAIWLRLDPTGDGQRAPRDGATAVVARSA